MITTKSHIEWNLTYNGEPMLSPVFSSYEDCVDYIQRSPEPDAYAIISRIVVTQTSGWAVWK